MKNMEMNTDISICFLTLDLYFISDQFYLNFLGRSMVYIYLKSTAFLNLLHCNVVYWLMIKI